MVFPMLLVLVLLVLLLVLWLRLLRLVAGTEDAREEPEDAFDEPHSSRLGGVRDVRGGREVSSARLRCASKLASKKYWTFGPSCRE